MAQEFRYQHLRSREAGRLPSVTEIREGELAVNFADEKIYLKNINDQIVGFITDKQVDAKIAAQSGASEAKIDALSGNVNTLNNKVDSMSGTVNTELASKVNTTTYDTFTADTNTALSNKADASTTYTKTEVDTSLGNKVNNTTYNTFTANTNTALNNKADLSAITTVETALNDLNGKMVAEIESSNGSITTSTSTRSDGSVKADIQTDASKISGLTDVSDSDEGAAKISGVTSTDSIRKGVENIYKSLASEIAARKAAFLARTISSANKGITVTETPNADGYRTTLTLTLDASTNGSGKEKLGSDNALTITDNGLFLSSNWTCGEYK